MENQKAIIMKLTRKQEDVLSFIKIYKEVNGYAPSQEEIAHHFQITQQTTSQHLKSLSKKNKIRTQLKVSRSIILL